MGRSTCPKWRSRLNQGDTFNDQLHRYHRRHRNAPQSPLHLVLEYPGPGGNASTGPTGEDIAPAILHGVNLAARVSGLTPEEYAGWLELNGRVHCAGLTARGKPWRGSEERRA